MSMARIGRSDDAGSMLPFVLLCFCLAALMVTGGIAASVAFLAQRDVQSLCDGAAVAAANGIDEPGYFGAAAARDVPLADATVRAAVGDYLGRVPDVAALTSWGTATDGRSVEVVCTRYVDIPFAAVFLGGRQLERTATASARAPYQG